MINNNIANNHPLQSEPSSHRQAGSAYFLVLASTMVLIALVLGLSGVVRHFRRSSQLRTHADQARIYCQQGIRHALHYTMVSPSWRSTLSSGDWLQNVPVGSALYSVEGLDLEDGILDDNNDDSVWLTCASQTGSVSRALKVEAAAPAWHLLSNAVVSKAKLRLRYHARIFGDVTCNDNIDKDRDVSIDGNIQLSGLLSNTDNITGTVQAGRPPALLPDSTTIINYYKSIATPIDYIPTIEKKRLSKSINPFGPTNPNGVYKINCQGQKIVIKDCRIVGTLILINPKADSSIESAINWYHERDDFPALIVQGGGITIKPDKDLKEWEIDRDMSMPGELGFGTKFGSYNNIFVGTIFCTGELTCAKFFYISGLVYALDDFEIKDGATCCSVSNWDENPTSQFREPYLLPIDGTWQEIPMN